MLVAAYLFGFSVLITPAFSSSRNQITRKDGANSSDSTWSTLLENCEEPTAKCVEKNMYKLMTKMLDYPKDYNVTSFLKFARNSVNYTEIDRERQDGESDNSTTETFDRVSRTFQSKGVEFLMTHDVEIKLPETFFEGATLRIAPRNLDGSGALLKLDVEERKVPEEGAVEGRIFFKKLKKKIGKKLLFALLAILLVIKLLAVKFLFFLPALVGVAAAKKFILKVLFFLFPAIKYLFKLCPYAPHGTKLHHHKHQISHIHHIGGGGHHAYPAYSHHSHHDGIEVIRPHSDGPPLGALGGSSLHHYVDIEQPHHTSSYHDPGPEYYDGGPGIGEQIISNRRDPDTEENEILGQGRPSVKKHKPLTPTEIENMVLKAEKEALIKLKLQMEKKRIQEENARLQEQLRQALKLQERLKLQQMSVLTRTGVLKSSKPTVPSPFLQSPPPSLHPQNDISLPVNHLFNSKNILKFTGQAAKNTFVQDSPPMTPPNSNMGSPHSDMGPFHSDIASGSSKIVGASTLVKADGNGMSSSKMPPQTHVKNDKVNVIQKAIQQAASITFDPFYSPILGKIDKILVNLGYTEEACKERLICFMYKSPEKYSPHSNLLSNELSRDADELQKPKTTNAAVVRFYRYMQAARDGQESQNCINLYPGCSLLGSEL